MSDFLQRLETEIQNRRLFKHGEKLLVAVSGGLDSMVLLHALKTLSRKNSWKLVVAHFNHRLRGRASDADEKLVRATAAALRLPAAVDRGEVKAFAQTAKLSIEMAARKLRHEFLAREAARRNIKTVALAHHADDQVELFFLRLLRGTGGEGLAGMKWRSPSPADPKITLVRPLLGFAKSELREFARENKVRFREDATNFSSDFLRNRIRNELLPLLRKKYQPALDRAVLRLMEIAGAEAEFVGEAAQRWERRQLAGVSRRTPKPAGRMPALPVDFDNLPAAIQRRVLQRQLTERGITADFALVESLRQTPNIFVSAGPKMSASRDGSGKIELRTEIETEFRTEEQAVNPSCRKKEAIFGDVKLKWHFRNGAVPVGRASSRTGGGAAKIFGAGAQGRSPRQKELFDAERIGGNILLRHWRPGDRFQPIGLTSAAKLQDLFVNAKIPRDRRRHLVVAEAAGGDIFWVEGLRVSERFKLTRDTKRVLVWRWSKLAV